MDQPKLKQVTLFGSDLPAPLAKAKIAKPATPAPPPKVARAACALADLLDPDSESKIATASQDTRIPGEVLRSILLGKSSPFTWPRL